MKIASGLVAGRRARRPGRGCALWFANDSGKVLDVLLSEAAIEAFFQTDADAGEAMQPAGGGPGIQHLPRPFVDTQGRVEYIGLR